jgi:enoyl-CoA hydratase
VSLLLAERAGSVLTLRINRPEAANALNAAVVASLGRAVSEAQWAPGIRVIVITAVGEKAFSAGADLKELAGLGPHRAHEVLAEGQRVIRAVERSSIPVIAAVNGVALGGGFELVLSCTFAVVSTRATFGLPESGLGLIPGYGGTQRLPRAIGRARASHLMLTGARLDAAAAADAGLTPIPPVEPAELGPTAAGIAAQIAAKGPNAVAAILRSIEASRNAPLDTGLSLETALAALAVAGSESDEGIAAFLERRTPVFLDQGTEHEQHG